MPNIIVKDHFDNELFNQSFEAGETFASGAMKAWPNGFFGFIPFMFGPDKKLIGDESECHVPMKEGEVWEIHLRPTGPLAPAIGAIGAFFAAGGGFWAAGGAFLGLSWFQVALTAVSLIGSFLTRPELPDLSGDSYEFTDDSVQYLTAESNSMTPGSRIADVFGSVRAYPKLCTEPVVFYNGTNQTIREMYIVTNGYADVSESRLHDEGMSSLPGSGEPVIYQQENPWALNNYDLTMPILKSNEFVGGVEIKAQNEDVGITQNITITPGNPAVIRSNINGFFSDFPDNWFFLDPKAEGASLSNGNKGIYKVGAIIDDGDAIEIAYGGPMQPTVAEVATGVTFMGLIDVYTNNTDWPVAMDAGWWRPNQKGQPYLYYTQNAFNAPPDSIKDGGMIYNGSNGARKEASFGTFAVPYYYQPEYEPGGDNAGSIKYTYERNKYKVEGTGYFNPFYYTKVSDTGGFNPSVPEGSGVVTAPFTVPGPSHECWFDIEFGQGLYYQQAGQNVQPWSVNIQVYYRSVSDTDGPWKTHASLSFTYTASARSARRYTSIFKWGDIGEPDGEYQVYFKRITDYYPDTSDRVIRDVCTLIGLKGRQILTAELVNDVSNVTYAELTLSTTDGSQVLRDRKLNCLVGRWLPYRRDDTNIAYGTLVQTGEVMDAILYTLIDQGNYDPNHIDRKGLQEIQDTLNLIRPGVELSPGTWNGFIDQEMSVEQQLTLLTRPHRISVFRRAGTIYFSRIDGTDGDQPKTLINARNKVEPEKKTFVMTEVNEPNIAIVRFKNELDSYKEASVQYPLDAVDDSAAQEQTVLGITDPESAQRLAQYLYDQKRYERDVAEVTIGPEGRLLAPGDVIAMTDHLTQEKPFEGELIKYDATTGTFTCDQEVPDGTYWATLRGADGELAVTETDSSPILPFEIVFEESSPTHQITEWSDVKSPSERSQIGLLYSFVPIAYPTEKNLFTVVDVDPSIEGTTKLSFKQYVKEAYQSDTIEGSAL